MHRYICHKIVEAAQIERVDGTTLFFTADSEAGPMFVAEDWLQKHKPEAGGYFVRYADGYTSYSPAKAFEEGYKKMSPVL